MRHLAVGLALGFVLDPGLLDDSVWAWVFPMAFFFVLVDRAASRGAGDVRVFLLGAAFSLVYNGAYAKDMQNGFAPLNLSWLNLLYWPLEWGMLGVLWLHLADALAPRDDEQPWWLAAPAAAAPAAGAMLVYGVRLVHGHYPGMKVLGPLWLLYDVFFLFAAAALARASEAAVWVVLGAGLWSAAARMISFLPAPVVFHAAWAGLLGAAGWTTWRDRFAVDGEPRRRDRLALTAAGLHAAAGLLSLTWLAVPFGLAAKLVFSYALLTRRLRV